MYRQQILNTGTHTNKHRIACISIYGMKACYCSQSTYLMSIYESRDCACKSQWIDAHSDRDEQTDGNVKLIVTQCFCIKLERCFDSVRRYELLDHSTLREGDTTKPDHSLM